ncbi:MAG: hypothetical protein EPN89_08865, partial [Methylovulum sp.]
MSPKSRTHDLLARWGSWSLNHSVVLLLSAALLVFFAWQYTASHLSINTDTTELVAPDAPFQQNRRHFEKEFPQDMRTLLLVL